MTRSRRSSVARPTSWSQATTDSAGPQRGHADRDHERRSRRCPGFPLVADELSGRGRPDPSTMGAITATPASGPVGKGCSAGEGLRWSSTSASRQSPASRRPTGPDPFAELKNRIHLALIGELGPQTLQRSGGDPTASAGAWKTTSGAPGQRPGSRETTRTVSRQSSRTTSRPRAARAPAARTTRCRRSWSTGLTTSGSSARAGSTQTTLRFTDESHLRRIINKIVAQVGRRIDESSPMVDARLPDGAASTRSSRRSR